jgi:tetratricopeptide (TPR) repeat protein
MRYQAKSRRLGSQVWVSIAISFLVVAATAAPADNMAAGYDHFYNLEYAQAIASFERAAAQNPNSPAAQNGIAQSVLYREMLRTETLDSEVVDRTNSFLRRPKMDVTNEAEARFLTAINKAFELSQEALSRNARDLEAMHARAVSFAFRSNWNFLVHKSWRDSLSDATGSRKLEDQILTIDAGDPDAPLGRGVHEYIIGGLPWAWRTLGLLAGFHGDKAKGLQIIEGVAKYGRRNKSDAQMLLCAFYRREGSPEKGLPVIAELIERYPRNYILQFEKARMYADIGDYTRALAVIDGIGKQCEDNARGFGDVRLAKIDYERAVIQFRAGLHSEALSHFRKAAASADDLTPHTRAECFVRIGQILDLMKDRRQAIDSYRKAIAFAPAAETAAESRRYIYSPYRR